MNYRDMLLQDYFDESYDDYYNDYDYDTDYYEGMPVSLEEAFALLEKGEMKAARRADEDADRAYALAREIGNMTYADYLKLMQTPAKRNEFLERIGKTGSNSGFNGLFTNNGTALSRAEYETRANQIFANISDYHRRTQNSAAQYLKNQRQRQLDSDRHNRAIRKSSKLTNENITKQIQSFGRFKGSGNNSAFYQHGSDTPAVITFNGTPYDNQKDLMDAIKQWRNTNANNASATLPQLSIAGRSFDLFSRNNVEANLKKQKNDAKKRQKSEAARAGASDASIGAAPIPEKTSRIIKARDAAKDWAGGHKRQLAIGGAAAAGAAGAGVTASGVKNIADLKNTAKAKAAWKASGSNLPFEEWRKKQLTKAGIKTGIGGALTALGAGGAVYAAKTHKLNEAEDLMEQYELLELEEAYLEGYYGQIIAEENGYNSEVEMLCETIYDDYDDYDYYDEDYMLPYFG